MRASSPTAKAIDLAIFFANSSTVIFFTASIELFIDDLIVSPLSFLKVSFKVVLAEFKASLSPVAELVPNDRTKVTASNNPNAKSTTLAAIVKPHEL